MLSSKDPGETITVTFDYTALTTSVTAPTVMCTMASGIVDASPSALLSGSPQISGAKVLQKIVGGLNGANYDLKCVATAADSSIYALADVLPVVLL